MTNFERMKQKMVETVRGLDEMELLRLAEDTEMSASGAEGIFNCTICEEKYGECDDSPCTSEHNRRYLDWCKKEYVSQDKSRKWRKNNAKCLEISRQQMEYS